LKVERTPSSLSLVLREEEGEERGSWQGQSCCANRSSDVFFLFSYRHNKQNNFHPDKATRQKYKVDGTARKETLKKERESLERDALAD
jgi:hypothetical protein